MENNIFKNLQEKKKQLEDFAKSALENKWITQETYDGIINKLTNDTLTIGVIGQMKCGKSTFLNAFLFGKEVLPAATTPMTAALSVITYGETEEIIAEFYSPEEWNELKTQAARSIDTGELSEIEKSKIKAAKELVEKSAKIGGSIDSLLGKTQHDSLGNLVEYVGADGKYVALTKSVTIHYPQEWLKGVEIVDTPGFNDPIVSRELRTQEFLEKADVALLILYAGRAFDSTDRDILFEKVRNVGVGKILIGVNKYDLCYENGETEEEIITNVSNEIKKACREFRNDLVSEMLKNENPILFSASMALMAKMPFAQIMANDDLKFHWNRTCDNFEISTQAEMLNRSLISNLDLAIRKVIEKGKYEILFRKPINMIMQAGSNAKEKITLSLNEKKELLKNLELPNDELDNKINDLKKAQRRIERKIDRAVSDLAEKYDETTSKLIHQLEDETDRAKENIHHLIETGKRREIERQANSKLDTLVKRTLPRIIEATEKNLKSSVVDTADDLCINISEVICKFHDDPDDLIEDFRNTIKREINGISFNEVNYTSSNAGKSESFGFWDVIGTIIIPLIPIMGPIIGIFDRISYRSDLHDAIDESFAKIDFNGIKSDFENNKQNYLNLLNAESSYAILPGLIDKLTEAQRNEEDKQEKIANARTEIETLKSQLGTITAQIAEMKQAKDKINL